MEFQSSENPGRKIPLDIVPKIKSGEVTTLVIPKNELPSYLNAALKTGFKVEEIAGEGGKFPVSSIRFKDGREEQEYDSDGTRKVVESEAIAKGCIAASVESPKGNKEDHSLFWRELERASKSLEHNPQEK